MSWFMGRRKERDDTSAADRILYTCPGCADWQVDAPSRYCRDIPTRAVDDALNEHREECPPLQAIYSRAVARLADKEVPVAPLDFDALAEIEEEITALAAKAARNGRAAREYVAWHERINELLTWRDSVIDSRGGDAG